MANQNFRPPRSLFGFGPQPLPGSQNPMVSSTMQDRFNRAGLQSFTPYIDPWSTVAQAQDYRNFERDLNRQEQIASAEDRFMQAVQEDPQTGYERFLQQNPLAVMSPMVRAYAVTRDRMRNEPRQDRLAVETAQLGSPYLSTYEKGRGAGKSDIQAYADAVSQYNRDQSEAKKKSAPDDRAPLSGEPAEKLAGIMSEIYEPTEPTDDEKMEFLPKGVDPSKATSADWSSAYYQAKQKKQQDAIGKLRTFQSIYGEMFKVPGMRNQAMEPATPQTAPLAPQATPEPLPTPGAPQPPPGPQNAPQAPPVPQEQPAPVPRKPGEPVTFENLTAEVDDIESGEKTKRLEDFKMREDIRQQESKQWEVAKNKLLQGIDADILRSLSPSPGPKEFAVFERIGVKPDAMAFRKPDGTDVSWYEAFVALAQDPRIQQLQQRNSAPARPPVGTSPSGAKVVIGQPVKVQ